MIKYGWVFNLTDLGNSMFEVKSEHGNASIGLQLRIGELWEKSLAEGLKNTQWRIEYGNFWPFPVAQEGAAVSSAVTRYAPSPETAKPVEMSGITWEVHVFGLLKNPLDSWDVSLNANFPYRQIIVSLSSFLRNLQKTEIELQLNKPYVLISQDGKASPLHTNVTVPCLHPTQSKVFLAGSSFFCSVPVLHLSQTIVGKKTENGHITAVWEDLIGASWQRAEEIKAAHARGQAEGIVAGFQIAKDTSHPLHGILNAASTPGSEPPTLAAALDKGNAPIDK